MASDGDGDLPPPPPPPPPVPALGPPSPQFFEEQQHELYPGEREDCDTVTALLASSEQPVLSKIMEPLQLLEPTHSSIDLSSVGGNLSVVMPVVNNSIELEFVAGDSSILITAEDNRDNASLSPQQHLEILEAYLQTSDWENLLLHLIVMVQLGYADKAVENADPDNIYEAHPELALLLLRQRYVDMRRSGQHAVASAYYRDTISVHYPHDTLTGSTFVNISILEGLRTLSRSIDNPPGDGAQDRDATRQAIRDYLLLYFPSYRPNVQGARRRSRVWELGEKRGRDARCLACHRLFVGLNVTKLRQHLEALGEGHVGRCIAVNEYIRGRLNDIVDEERGQEDAAAAAPAGPDEDNQGEAAPAANLENLEADAGGQYEANDGGVAADYMGNQDDTVPVDDV